MPTTPKTINITVKPSKDSFASLEFLTLYIINEIIPLTKNITDNQNTIIK